LASHTAISAVSRTLRTLLHDRMVTNAKITLAPLDAELAGPRVNLYLMQVIENASLKNQEIPDHGHPAAYGHPPLSLDLRYLMTTYGQLEDQEEGDLSAQTILGDAMRVMNDFGNRIDQLAIINPVAGTPGDPILDPDLAQEFERLRIVLHPMSLDDITKVWSVASEINFRRSVVYEVTVVQIETPTPRVRPLPVETRRIFVSVRKRPEIVDAYVAPTSSTDPIGETRARIGDEITIVSEHSLADKLYVRLGKLDPICMSPPGDGRVRIVLPDGQYPPDLDHPPLPVRPIPADIQLQPGQLSIQLIGEHPAEGVEGGLGLGKAIDETRRYRSNIWLLQLVPSVASATSTGAGATEVMHITGQRLWHEGAAAIDVIVGDAAIPVRAPSSGDPWATPTPTDVEIPMAPLREMLVVSTTPYRVAVQVDGARSRDNVTFILGP
jgi:hypothetical protein